MGLVQKSSCPDLLGRGANDCWIRPAFQKLKRRPQRQAALVDARMILQVKSWRDLRRYVKRLRQLILDRFDRPGNGFLRQFGEILEL